MTSDSPNSESENARSNPPTYLTKRIQSRHHPREIKSALQKVLSSELIKRKCKLTMIPDEHFYDELSDMALRALRSASKEFQVGTVIKKDQRGTLHSLFETDMIVLGNAIREVLIKRFNLPPDDISAEFVLQVIGIESEAKPTGTATHVLIVEDNPRTSKVVQLLLAKNGIVAHIAPHAKRAVEILDKEPIQMILMDYNLPGLSGGEFVSMLKNSNRFSAIPIVMASAMADEAIIRSCLQKGAVDYVLKPFKGETLLEKIKKHAVGPKVS